MSQTFLRNLLILVLPVILLVGACGGGGIGSVAGIEGTGISSGSTTNFGSIVVNGVDFDTENAEILFDGEQQFSLDLFNVGDVVTVEGSINDDGTGIATKLTFDRDLDGPVEAFDINSTTQTGTVTALGQTVVITEDTQFIPALDGFEVSLQTIIDPALPRGGTANLIAVSGFTDGEGRLIATTIRQGSDFAATTKVDVEGEVQNLDESLQQFRINDLLVDYSSLSSDPDESMGELTNGAFVEVFGTRENVGTLNAVSVTVIDRTIGIPGRRLEIEGIVANLDGNNNFTISGQSVNASSVEMQLEDGMRLEVEGDVDESGVLSAEAIIQIQPSNTLLTTIVDQVDIDNLIIGLLGQDVAVTNQTRFVDSSATSNTEFSLDSLYQGQSLFVAAHYNGSSLVANLVKRIDPPSISQASGPVTELSLAAKQIYISGVKVVVDDGTEFINVSGSPFSQMTFFSQLAEGVSRVEATGVKAVNNTILAKSLQVLEVEAQLIN